MEINKIPPILLWLLRSKLSFINTLSQLLYSTCLVYTKTIIHPRVSEIGGH